MAKKEKTYTRLPGRGSATFGLITAERHTLWMGRDHVLALRNTGFTEEYRRFYFADIQAIVVRRTAARLVWAIVTGVPAAAALALAVTGGLLGWNLGVVIAAGVCLVVFGLPALVNSVRGPTCVCTLRTAVQTERLYSLHRLRTALRVIRRIRAAIESVQGALTPEQTALGLDALAQQAAAQAAADAGRPAGGRPRTVSPYNGAAHWALFIILLADLAHSLASLFVHDVLMLLLGMGLGLGLTVCTVVAMVRQHDSELPNALKRLVWGVMGYLLAVNLYGSVYSAVFSATHPEVGGNTWRYVQIVARVSPFESPARMVMLALSIACSAVMGLAGLTLLVARRRRHSRPQPTPPSAAVPPPAEPAAAAAPADAPAEGHNDRAAPGLP